MAKKFIISCPYSLANEVVQTRRQEIAATLGVPADDVLFLAGGTTITEIELPDPPPAKHEPHKKSDKDK